MSLYTMGPKAQAASEYFNSLPQEQKAQLVPLLEEYRRRGIIEACEHIQKALSRVDVHRRAVGALAEGGPNGAL